MKKRLLSIALVAILLLSVLSMASCGLPVVMKTKGAEYSFGYSSCSTTAEWSSMKGTLDFVYVDTTLYLCDDGTWMIVMDDEDLFTSLIVDGVIDEGTFTEQDGVYTFIGFEYEMETVGEMSDDSFEIYFKDPTGTNENAFILSFKR